MDGRSWLAAPFPTVCAVSAGLLYRFVQLISFHTSPFHYAYRSAEFELGLELDSAGELPFHF